MSEQLSSTAFAAATGQTEPRFSRRQLIKAGAWAAPVIVLATASPAAAASMDTTVTAAAITAPVPAARVEGTDTVVLDHASVFYDNNKWASSGQRSQIECPATATVSWRVALKRADGTVFGHFPIAATATPTLRIDALPMSGTAEVRTIALTGVPAGTYTVVTEMVSVAYGPNPVKGSTFASSAFSSDATPAITIAPPTPDPAPAPAVTKAAIVAAAPRAQSGGPNRAALNYASVFYDYNQWETSQTAAPRRAEITWRVVLTNAAGVVVGAFTGPAPLTHTIDAYGTARVEGLELTGLPAGTYSAVTEVIAVSYSANPVDGVMFATESFSSQPTTFAVKNTW